MKPNTDYERPDNLRIWLRRVYVNVGRHESLQICLICFVSKLSIHRVRCPTCHSPDVARNNYDFDIEFMLEN